VIGALLSVHFWWWSRDRSRELAAVVLLAGFGAVGDSVLIATGAVVLAANPWGPLSPPWMIALWAHFATATAGPLGRLAGRWWLAAAVGAVAGPLAYWAGGRLGALDWPRGLLVGVVAVAPLWALAVPLVLWLAPQPKATT
jgi:hypothetical protein